MSDSEEPDVLSEMRDKESGRRQFLPDVRCEHQPGTASVDWQISQTSSGDYAQEGRRGRGRHGKEVSLDQSFKNIFMGIAFLIIAIALSRSIGYGWWYWMLIPAFSMLGTGIAQYIRLKERDRQSKIGAFPAAQVEKAFPNSSSSIPLNALPRRNTGELVPTPPSVTEGTTRHLGVEAPTRHLDATSDQK